VKNLKSIRQLLDEAERDGIDSESIFVNANDIYILDSDDFNPEDGDIEEETDE
jgi:hypothetical protein